MNRNLGALNKETRLYTSPNIATKRNTYICLDCEKDLVFCKGKIKPPYFRHKVSVNNPCTYYNKSPSESQIHLDGKYKLKSILEKKKLTLIRECGNCNTNIEFKIPKCKEDSKIVIEYGFEYKNNRKVADVACINNRGNLEYIIEICNTNHTNPKDRPEPWYEISAKELVKMNDIDKVKSLKCIREYQCFECKNKRSILVNNSNKTSSLQNLEKSKLTLYQKGAGNGKTYGLWKDILETPNKSLFMVLLGKHSEKEVILEELKDQKNKEWDIIDENIIEDDFIDKIKSYGKRDTNSNEAKQYEIIYTHKKSNRTITILIATVASFYYSISEMDINSDDPFSTLCVNFLEKPIKKIGESGNFWFVKKDRQLDNQTILCFDEAEDLHTIHLDCLKKLMSSFKIDVILVGDKLQSLSLEKNIFTEIDKIKDDVNEYMEVITIQPENNNRRIEVEGLDIELNKYIDFDKFNLPQITSVGRKGDKNLEKVNKPFELIKVGINEQVYAGDKNQKKIDGYCEKILEKFRKEIYDNLYLPQDFMIVTPILKGHNELIELKSKLEDLWITIFNDETFIEKLKSKLSILTKDKKVWVEYWLKENHNIKEKIVEYVQFHKCESGKVVNLSESKYKTRIVSTVTSRGDGRNVCFVLGVKESSLKLVSGKTKGLRYESHLHVPLTRAKRKVYFELVNNGDDIYRRFNDNTDDIYCPPKIKSFINIDKIGDYLNEDNLRELLQINGIKYKKQEEDQDKPRIDFTDHCSRYAVFKTLLHFSINKKIFAARPELVNKTPSILTYRNIIFKLGIGNKRNSFDYWDYLKKETKECKNNKKKWILSEIPIINYNSKYYDGFVDNIILKMKQLQDKIGPTFSDTESYNLNEIDYLLLTYMLNINRYKLYSPLNINDLYSVINKLETPNKHTNIVDFYKKILPIENKCYEMIQEIENTYGTMTGWNIEHRIDFEGESNDFKLTKKPSILIGYNDKYVVDVIIETSYDELNYFNIIKKILLNRFIIYNPEAFTEHSKNKERYLNKEIITYILILETNTYIKYDWKWDNCDEVRMIIKDGTRNYLTSFHKELYNYFYSILRCKKEDELLPPWIKIKTTEKGDYGTPFDYIIEKLGITIIDSNGRKKQYPPVMYIVNFIEILKNDYKKNKEEFRETVNNEEIFIEKLGNKLKDSLDKYFDKPDEYIP